MGAGNHEVTANPNSRSACNTSKGADQVDETFVQVLFGGVHASGALSGVASGSSNGVAFSAGGGLDDRLNRHFTVRILQPEYLYTHIPNGVNDHQNSLRFSSGVVFHF